MDAAAISSVAAVIGSAWTAVGPLVGVVLGWWLARRAARGDEQRRWAVELRRILGRATRAAHKYGGLVNVGPQVAQAKQMPVTPEQLRQGGQRLWQKVADPLEDDFFLYLEVLPFFSNDQRFRAIVAWHEIGSDPAGMSAADVAKRIDSLDAVLGELTVAIDRAMGLKTQRMKAAERRAKEKR